MSQQDLAQFVAVVIFHQLTPNLLNALPQRPTNYLGYLKELSKLSLEANTTQCLLKILQATSA